MANENARNEIRHGLSRRVAGRGFNHGSRRRERRILMVFTTVGTIERLSNRVVARGPQGPPAESQWVAPAASRIAVDGTRPAFRGSAGQPIK
jgi:hypothetical protein